MRRLAVIAALVGLGASAWGAENVATFEGHELKVVSVARAKEFRDLKVKDAKKQDLAIVVLELRWTGEGRTVLIRDKDLSVRDNRGGNQACLLRFVQAVAPADSGAVQLEIPFLVKAELALASLRVGKASLAIDSPASAPQP